MSAQWCMSPAEQDYRYLDRLPAIEADFRNGYDETVLEHHVWDHGLDVTSWDFIFREEMKAAGVPNLPGVFMTHIKGKGHDYGYKKFFDLKRTDDNPYDSAEQLTVVEGGDVLRSHGIDEYTIDEWASYVWGTKLGVRCLTAGAYSLCAADMANTGQDYDAVMEPATIRLLHEKQKLEDPTIDEATFAIGSLIIVPRYHFENLGATHFLDYSPSMRALHEGRAANLPIMARRTAEKVGKVGEAAVQEFIEKLGTPATKILPFLQQRAS